MSRITFPANQRTFKNRIINGDFSIWQRGTSASYVSDSANLTADAGYKSADRIYCANTRAGGQFTVSRSTMNGFNSFKVAVDTPPDNLTWDGTNARFWAPFVYRFEGQHLYDIAIQRKPITISFLFRSNVKGDFYISFRKSYGGIYSYVIPFSYNTVNSIQRIKATIPLINNNLNNDSSGGWELIIASIGDSYTTSTTSSWVAGDFHNGTNYTNWASNAGNYIEIAQLQLEEGEVATEFEYIPYDIQLMRCMRYYESYEKFYVEINHINLASQTVSFPIHFKVNKRVAPSVSYTYDSSTNIDSTNIDSTNFIPYISHCILQVSVGTDGATAWADFGYLKFDAEL